MQQNGLLPRSLVCHPVWNSPPPDAALLQARGIHLHHSGFKSTSFGRWQVLRPRGRRLQVRLQKIVDFQESIEFLSQNLDFREETIIFMKLPWNYWEKNCTWQKQWIKFPCYISIFRILEFLSKVIELSLEFSCSWVFFSKCRLCKPGLTTEWVMMTQI